MVYETSYESGRKPFSPDLTRGYWDAPSDFIYACLGMAFKFDILSISWVYFHQMGVFAIVPYIICLVLYVTPILVIQSFLGQFSSSGFISAFRISPLFKGMGYISLVLNFSILTYYSLFVSVPLLYLFNSFRPTLPWSCEGFASWSKNITTEQFDHICNITVTEESNVNDTDYNMTNYSYLQYHLPSVLFFKTQFGKYSLYHEKVENSVAWSLIACTLVTWSIIAGFFYKVVNVQKFGKILRYATWLVLGLLMICITRFLFLPGTITALKYYVQPEYGYLDGIPNIPFYTMSVFGSGWGAIVSLSSFNKFKTNIMRYSWIIVFGQMLIFMAFAFISFLVEYHLKDLTEDNFLGYVEQHWTLYLSTGSAIANLELPNMWSIIFYAMLVIASLIIMVTQIYSILVSIFDEFETLRPRKTQVTFILIGLWALFSLFFCSHDAILSFPTLSMDTIFTQAAINLLLLLVVLWIYGRIRFQRDIEFMLGTRFGTWKVYMLRFVAPLFLLFIMLAAGVVAFFEHLFNTSVLVQIAALIFILIPWLFIPGYGIISMLQTTGSFCMRFRRCCRPTDWYPVQMEDRQRYEESMGNMDITHQLNEVSEDVP